MSPEKKYKHYGQQSQLFNTLTTSINAIAVKKDKKNQDKKNLNQVKYYVYHMKNYYTNKSSDKKPKN